MVSSRRHFAFAFLVAVAIFIAAHFIEFRGSVPEFLKSSGGGVLLDMKPAFTEDALYERLVGYGEPGRVSYAFRLLTVDILLPLGLLAFLLMLMSRALKQTSIGKVPRAILLSLPVVYVVLDLAENGVLFAILRSFPDRLPLAATVLPYLTVVKRIASLLSLFVPLLILAFVFTRLQIRKRHPLP